MEKPEIMIDEFNKTLFNLQKAVNDLADHKWVPTLIDKCVRLENRVEQLLGEKNAQVIKNDRLENKVAQLQEEKNIQVIKNSELTRQNGILTKTISTLSNQKAHQTAKSPISAQPPLSNMDRLLESAAQRDEIVGLSKRVQILERDLALHRARRRHSNDDPTAPAHG